MIAPWVAKYIGLPFEDKGRGPAFDCWGLTREVLRVEKGLILPDYAEAYSGAGDRLSVASAVESGILDWTRVRFPIAFDLIILKIGGRPWHCGLAVGQDWMLHTLSGVGSVVEQLNSPIWANRIEGFYRHD